MNLTTITALAAGIVIGAASSAVTADAPPMIELNNDQLQGTGFEWLKQQADPQRGMSSRVDHLESKVLMLEQRLAELERGEPKYLPVPAAR